MQRVHATVEVHGEQETNESEVVIAMQVTDEDMLKPVMAEVELAHLHLGAFPAVDEEMPVLNHQVLRRRSSSIGRDGAAGAEDGELEQIS